MIRQATILDASAIAQIHVQTWQIAYRGIVPDSYLDALSIEQRVEQWRSILSKSAAGTWVSEVDKEIVGWISFGQSRDQDAHKTGEIYAIYVQSTMWRYGIGRELMALAEEQLWRSKVETITLWVLEDNVSGREFYTTLGYSFDGTKREENTGGKMLVDYRYVKCCRSGAE